MRSDAGSKPLGHGCSASVTQHEPPRDLQAAAAVGLDDHDLGRSDGEPGERRDVDVMRDHHDVAARPGDAVAEDALAHVRVRVRKPGPVEPGTTDNSPVALKEELKKVLYRLYRLKL